MSAWVSVNASLRATRGSCGSMSMASTQTWPRASRWRTRSPAPAQGSANRVDGIEVRCESPRLPQAAWRRRRLVAARRPNELLMPTISSAARRGVARGRISPPPFAPSATTRSRASLVSTTSVNSAPWAGSNFLCNARPPGCGARRALRWWGVWLYKLRTYSELSSQNDRRMERTARRSTISALQASGGTAASPRLSWQPKWDHRWPLPRRLPPRLLA